MCSSDLRFLLLMKARSPQPKETRVPMETQRVADPSEIPSLKVLVKASESMLVCPLTTSSPRASAISEMMSLMVEPIRVTD